MIKKILPGIIGIVSAVSMGVSINFAFTGERWHPYVAMVFWILIFSLNFPLWYESFKNST